MPSTSKNESLSPQLELRATITSIEGVPNLPTMSSSSTMVARRKNNEANVELFFENVEDPPDDPAEDPPEPLENKKVHVVTIYPEHGNNEANVELFFENVEDPPDDLAEDPPEPLEKKVHVVTIYPEHGYIHQGSHVPQQDNPINEAYIVPILRFEFELRGNHKKITTTLRTQCNLGEGGVLNGTPSNLGYFQDNITISLTCEKARAATLSSSKVEDVKVVKRTITNNNSTSVAREGSGQVAVLGLQVGGSYGGTTETGYSTADEKEIECLGGGFWVHPRQLPGSLAYNFSYPKKIKDIIADHRHGRTELLDLKIGDTVWPTIIGEWDALDMSRKCRYNFTTRRDITSIKGLRQSHRNGEELQYIQQQYVVPLWVNHAMTHILHRDDTIQAPGRVRKVIGAKPALHGLVHSNIS